MLTRLIRWCRVVDAAVYDMATDVEHLESRVLALLADLWDHRSTAIRAAEQENRRRATRVLQLATERAEISRHLRRARDAIAVLYVGTKSRRVDGTVDVDAVIDSVLGEA
jgi:outer membrane murein-binding lipoprotein Lpp